MADWQVQAMWETESAMIWEEMHKPDPNEGRYAEAQSSMEVALKHLREAMEWMNQAADEVHGLPMEDKLISLSQSIEELGLQAMEVKNER